MKQIIVNVGGLTIEEKKRVNKALAKIKNIMPCPPMILGCPMDWESVSIMFVTSYDGVKVCFDACANQIPTHTVRQVLEMAEMAEQGHVHAESMALYADDAKTHAKPWKLWQVKADDGVWWDCDAHPRWANATEYQRKPKTHIVNGVEVPDLRVDPKNGQGYWYPDSSIEALVCGAVHGYEQSTDSHRLANNLCYAPTEEGKQAAILHAKAWLGIV